MTTSTDKLSVLNNVLERVESVSMTLMHQVPAQCVAKSTRRIGCMSSTRMENRSMTVSVFPQPVCAITNAFKTFSNTPPLPVCPGPEKLAVSPVSTVSQKKTDKPLDNLPTKPPRKAAGGGFRFGDRKKRDVEILTKPGVDCRSLYCEDGSSYPSDIILRAVTDNKELNPDLFAQLFDQKCTDPIKSRFSNIDEEQLCYGVPKVIYPRQAKNLKEEWRYIVNVENYTQSVEIEECYDYSQDFETTTKSETDDNTVQFNQTSDQVPEDFGSCLYSGAVGNNPDLTRCKQLYTEHKLLALSADGQLEVDSFQLPSACACFYKEDLVLEFRRNMNKDVELPELPDQVEETLKFGSK